MLRTNLLISDINRITMEQPLSISFNSRCSFETTRLVLAITQFLKMAPLEPFFVRNSVLLESLFWFEH